MIEVGSVWVNRCDGSEVAVVQSSSQCVQFSTIFDGKEWLHSHTVADFKKYYNPVITKDSIWIERATGKEVLVIFVSDELVTYQKQGSQTPVPVRKFVFMQDFEEKGCE